MRSSLFAALALLQACSSYTLATPKVAGLDGLGPAPASVGQVCVFRPHPVGVPMTLTLRDDGKLVGATHGSGYFCYLASVS